MPLDSSKGFYFARPEGESEGGLLIFFDPAAGSGRSVKLFSGGECCAMSMANFGWLIDSPPAVCSPSSSDRPPDEPALKKGHARESLKDSRAIYFYLP